MPSYTPNNLTAYTAAITGALAGMVASLRFRLASDITVYTLPSTVAGAFAQSFDALWGTVVPNTMQVLLINVASKGFWESRYPLNNAQVLDPASYTLQCEGIIASILALSQYAATQGIVFDPWPSSTPVDNGETVESVSFDFTSSSPVIIGAINSGQIMNRAVILIEQAFDGVNPQVLFGTTSDPNQYLKLDANTTISNQYESDELHINSINDIMILSINSNGSTQGTGTLFYKLL